MENKKESTVKRVLKKVEDKGFYIILSLCVVAIGVSGYVLFFTDTMDGDDFGAAIDIDSILEPLDPDVIPGNDEPVSTDTDNGDIGGTIQPDEPTSTDQPGSQEPQEPVNGSDEQPSDSPVVQVRKAVAPTGGQIIKEFSGDKLVFDVTMEDWRTHNGTDFSCTQGDTVFCMRDGTVTNVFEDGLLGHSVTVQHTDGIVTTYSGLSAVAVVKKGDRLKMGDAVGTAGGTAIGESNQPYHIHVSVTQNGKYIDAMNLF